jgi:hypothetical protein
MCVFSMSTRFVLVLVQDAQSATTIVGNATVQSVEHIFRPSAHR